MGKVFSTEAVLLFTGSALGAHGPERSGLPSARRGTGPEGGQPGLGMNPSTGCAKISSCAAAGAAHINPNQTAHARQIPFIYRPLSSALLPALPMASDSRRLYTFSPLLRGAGKTSV